ncbi:MAG: hypothetical protein ACE15E_00775 [Acidobacteriota bacterium]
MTSPLRSFFQFAPLERKLRQVAGKSDWKERIKASAGPPLVDYELAKARLWEATTPPSSRLAACLDAITAPAREPRPPQEADLLELQSCLLDRPVQGREFRQGTGGAVIEGQVRLDATAVPRALGRFFEWTASEAFSEMHALEQMTLCQVRLYEIWPFEMYSGLTADFFSLRVLYLRTSLLPLFTVEETDDFHKALSKAFGFVTKPLVDFYLRACERACDLILRQL